LTADCAVGGAPAVGGAGVVSGPANRFGETSVIEEAVGAVALAGEMLGLRARRFVADDEAPGV